MCRVDYVDNKRQHKHKYVFFSEICDTQTEVVYKFTF
jgi:hypothetical protein